jgi:hypothetical protein
MCVCVSVCLCACASVYVHVCVGMCTSVYMCLHVLRACVSEHACVHACVCICAQAHICVHLRTCLSACTCVHLCVSMYVHWCICICVHACMSVCACVCVHECGSACGGPGCMWTSFPHMQHSHPGITAPGIVAWQSGSSLWNWRSPFPLFLCPHGAVACFFSTLFFPSQEVEVGLHMLRGETDLKLLFHTEDTEA